MGRPSTTNVTSERWSELSSLRRSLDSDADCRGRGASLGAPVRQMVW